MIVAAMFAARKGYPVGVRVPFSEATKVFFRAIPSLMLLVIVIGGIVGGTVYGYRGFGDRCAVCV